MACADTDLPASTALLLQQVRACTLCAPHLPMGARPVLQVHPSARILIAGQAPGVRVHHSGVPFDDASGDRLRQWMGVTREVFYDPELVAILPMGFCYPGTGPSGDLPPRSECAVQWRERLLQAMPLVELTLVIGTYAIAWHLPDAAKTTLTATAQSWQSHWPHIFPLPHPSPRNNIWLKKNPWFAKDLIPSLQKRIQSMALTKGRVRRVRLEAES